MPRLPIGGGPCRDVCGAPPERLASFSETNSRSNCSPFGRRSVGPEQWASVTGRSSGGEATAACVGMSIAVIIVDMCNFEARANPAPWFGRSWDLADTGRAVLLAYCST